MGYRFYGYNLSKARRLRHEIQVLQTCFGKCKGDKSGYVELIVSKREELNGLIVKGVPFELFKGFDEFKIEVLE